jgi:hypothetical protein
MTAGHRSETDGAILHNGFPALSLRCWVSGLSANDAKPVMRNLVLSVSAAGDFLSISCKSRNRRREEQQRDHQKKHSFAVYC